MDLKIDKPIRMMITFHCSELFVKTFQVVLIIVDIKFHHIVFYENDDDVHEMHQ